MRDTIQKLTTARAKLTRSVHLLREASTRFSDSRSRDAAGDAEFFIRQAIRCFDGIELDDETTSTNGDSP